VAQAAASAEYRSKDPKDVRVLVVGPTGYIGKYVVQECIKRGYNTVAFSRPKAGIKGKLSMDDVRKEFAGADVKFGDVTDLDSIRKVAFENKVDVVISCLASRTGAERPLSEAELGLLMMLGAGMGAAGSTALRGSAGGAYAAHRAAAGGPQAAL
jgi:NAD(P)-dependent dehydrogenase (short-subunit alcohol dehydrogenase family)